MDYQSNDGSALSLHEEQKRPNIFSSALRHPSLYSLSLNPSHEEPVREDTTMMHSPNFSSLRRTTSASINTLASLDDIRPATIQNAPHSPYKDHEMDVSVVRLTFPT